MWKYIHTELDWSLQGKYKVVTCILTVLPLVEIYERYQF
jgi:hypothetical protein